MDPDSDTEADVNLALWSCRMVESIYLCHFYHNANNHWTNATNDSNLMNIGWHHICFDYDFRSMNLSIAIDQRHVHSSKLDTKFIFDIVKIAWIADDEIELIQPGKFSLLNIYSRYL